MIFHVIIFIWSSFFKILFVSALFVKKLNITSKLLWNPQISSNLYPKFRLTLVDKSVEEISIFFFNQADGSEIYRPNWIEKVNIFMFLQVFKFFHCFHFLWINLKILALFKFNNKTHFTKKLVRLDFCHKRYQ